MNRICVAAGLTAALLAGTAAGTADAQTKTLYIGMNGGTMEKTFTQNVFPDFEKANDAKVVVVPGTSSEILAKLQASKDKPQMHVVFLDDGVMYRAISMGLCQKMTDDPVMSEIRRSARLKDDMAVGIDLGLTGLGYNKKLFEEKGWAPPTSWMDLADPKYKGKVVFQSAPASSFGLHGFLMFNRIQGGSESNVEPGFTKWASTIGPNVLEYIPSSAKISEMVQTGEAAIFPLTPTNVANQAEKGIPIAYANPKEGGVILMVAECVVAKNDNMELAQKLAHYLLSQQAQSNALKYGNQIPSNTNVVGEGENQAKLTRMVGYLGTAVTLDWDAINEKRSEWNARWNKSIER